jgi:hypothetical protein
MTVLIEESFARLGVRAKVERVPRMLRHRTTLGESPVKVDVLQDSAGPYFFIQRLWNVQLSVREAQPDDRHLLLVAEHAGQDERFSRFLCGHDERAWFAAAIPEVAEAKTVQDAKDALKPQEVWDSIAENNLPLNQRDLRYTAAFVRQGEWFFIPRSELEVDAADILWNEPISRGGGKPHFCEMVYRTGGTEVYVSWMYPNGLSEAEYRELNYVERKHAGPWDQRTRDAEVYASGCVRHPDHATIRLPCWHRVVMNTETKARAMENVAFLD